MICRARPYEGEEPFVFFSYCPADEESVFPVVEYLARNGVRVWYENGSVEKEKYESAADRIQNCSLCIAGISSDYFQSHRCRNELNCVAGTDKPLIAVQLSDFSVSVGFQLSLAEAVCLRKDECYDRLLSVKGMEVCCGVLPLIDEEEGTFGRTVYKKDKTAVLFGLNDNSLILLKKNNISIGRGEECDFRIRSSEVSSRHAEILHSLGNYYVRDNHSANGSFVNGVPVGGTQPVKLTDGAVLSFSDEKYIFAEGTTAKFLMERATCSYLMCVETEDVQMLSSHKLLLGRLNQWPRGTFSARSASRVHGEISFDSDRFTLNVPEHIGQPRTAVNGKHLAEGETAELKHADEIEIGSGLYHILFATKTIAERRAI